MRLVVGLVAGVVPLVAQSVAPWTTTKVPTTASVPRTPTLPTTPAPTTRLPPSSPTIRPATSTTTTLSPHIPTSPPPRTPLPISTTQSPPPPLTPQPTEPSTIPVNNTLVTASPAAIAWPLVPTASDPAAESSPAPSNSTAAFGSSSSTTILLAVLCSVVTLAGVAGIYFFVYRSTGFISDYEASIVASETPCRRSSFAATMGASYYEDITTTTIQINPKHLKYDKVLGTGSMCEVWLAQWKPNPAMDTTPVAVKRLLPKRRNDHDVCTFLGDTRLQAVLRHPNIVAVLGVSWHSKSNIEVVLEYMEGGNLRQLLATSNPLSMGWLGTKQEIAVDVVDALVYLHQEEIVHQKLTAETVLIHTGRRGIGAKLGNCGSMYRSHQPTMTARSTISFSIFSPKSSRNDHHDQRRKWMAPEVLRGEEPTRASDMYAFGVLLSVLDTHDDPFKRETMDESVILQRVSLGDLRPTLSLLCPPFIHDIAQKCLDSNPDHRPTALDVAGWLHTPGLCSPSIVSTSAVHSRRGSLPLSASSSGFSGSLPSLSLGRPPRSRLESNVVL